MEEKDKKDRYRGGGTSGRSWKTMKVKRLEVEIVETILGDPTNATIVQVAERLGKPVSTVARHMRKPEIQERLRSILFEYVDKKLVHHAVANITRAVITDKDVKVSQWLLENLDFFPREFGPDAENAWEEFQRRFADNMADIMRSVAKGGNGNGDAKLDPNGFIVYQPQPPVFEN